MADYYHRQWASDLERYKKYKSWADKGSASARQAMQSILSKYPDNLHKHFT